MVYPMLRPLIFMLDAERAHGLTLAALKMMPGSSGPAEDPRLAVRVAGLDFPNLVGLAAGFDKNAEVYRQVLELGFGFAEVGTITPLPQSGNPRPRSFRLVQDRAVINRMGFNNEGLGAARRRLLKRNRKKGIVGVNVGANKDSSDRVADYAAGVRAMAPLADYLTVNISSPNTPGLRALQDRGALDELLAAVMDAKGGEGPPIFLKVAPDLERQDVDDIAAVSIERGVDAIIVSNTTISRPDLVSRHRSEGGGLSGAPLKRLALERLRDFRRATGGAVPLIAAGGIENGVDAYDRIKAGASLVQLYSALVYQGPGLARMIAGELRSLLVRDGFSNIAQAIGAEEQ
jgi:dihydroorotate dehydrogenase